jgi:tetratricopeptide (TPR) repeat protein
MKVLRAKQIALVLLLLMLPMLAGCAKLRARDELNKGVRAFKGGDINAAIDHFKTSIDLDPELLNAQLYLATAYASQFVPGSQSEKNRKIAAVAIAEFEKVLERDPGNINALKNIASIQFNLKEWDKAKAVRRQLNELDPDNPEHYYAIGVINWTATYAERMGVRADLKIQNAPERPIPRRERLRLAETNTERVEEGIEALGKALLINPNYLEAMAYLNLMYREKADLLERDGREEFLDKADAMVDRHKETMEKLKKEAEESQPTP